MKTGIINETPNRQEEEQIPKQSSNTEFKQQFGKRITKQEKRYDFQVMISINLFIDNSFAYMRCELCIRLFYVTCLISTNFDDSMRKLKFHEMKLLQKVNLLKTVGYSRKNLIICRYRLTGRDDYKE